MQIVLDSERLPIRLAPWEKALGLMGDISVERGRIRDVEVVDDGVRAAMRSGMKAGLRVPWVRYLARTISLEEVFLVRRGVPTLAFSVADGKPLRRVFVSTPDAPRLANELSGTVAPGR